MATHFIEKIRCNIKARPVCLPARCAQAGVRYAQAGAIISTIHELSGLGLFVEIILQ